MQFHYVCKCHFVPFCWNLLLTNLCFVLPLPFMCLCFHCRVTQWWTQAIPWNLLEDAITRVPRSASDSTKGTRLLEVQYAHGGFLKWGYPNSWTLCENGWIMTIWGYRHFWKPQNDTNSVSICRWQGVGLFAGLSMQSPLLSIWQLHGTHSCKCWSEHGWIQSPAT